MVDKIIFFLILMSFSPQLHCLTHEEIKAIGMQIWKNEGHQKDVHLVFWSEHESFPSLGIGHFIWFPIIHQKQFSEEFPRLCVFLKTHNIPIPSWLQTALKTGAPWGTREEFLEDTKHVEDLRKLLRDTIELQTEFMIQKLDHEFELILKAATRKQKNQLHKNFEYLRSSLLGNYALIDYLNFKGSGLNPQEKSKGKSWGLMQVLLDMPKDTTKENANKSFAISAAKNLIILVQNSSPEYNRIKFLNGWIKRINSYTDTNLFKEIIIPGSKKNKGKKHTSQYSPNALY